MEFLIYWIAYLSTFLIAGFFLYQAIENGRSPIAVFISPISNKECKILCEFIETGTVEKTDSAIYNKIFNINNGQFFIKQLFINDNWTVNGVRLSVLQEYRILKALDRHNIKAKILTSTGQVLYGVKNGK